MGLADRGLRRLREDAAYRVARARVRSAVAAVPLVAVVHVFYGELWPDLRDRLAVLPPEVPRVFTVPEGAALDQQTRADLERAGLVLDLPNRGRDVLPFLVVADALRSAAVDAVLKLQSKRSPHAADGGGWRDSLVTDLLPDADVARRVTATLEDPRAGVVLPASHVYPLRLRMRANERHLRSLLTSAAGADAARRVLTDPDRWAFVGGTMLWMRLDALGGLPDLAPRAFEREAGQVDGTMAHAVERLLSVLPAVAGREVWVVDAEGPRPLTSAEVRVPDWATPEDLEDVSDE